MDIKSSLREFAAYFRFNRQVGHTTTMIEGLRGDKRVVLVVPNLLMGDHIKRMAQNRLIKTVTPNSITRIYGHTDPMVFDHTALEQLFLDALKRIETLEDEIKRSL